MSKISGQQSLCIFNRWGEMMFEVSTYKNNRDGNTTNGHPALDGLQLTNKDEKKNGWLNAMRPWATDHYTSKFPIAIS